MEAEEVCITTPSYKEIGSFEGVLLKVPSIDDIYMKWISKHKFNGREIPGHYRRGDLIDGKLAITRNFYTIDAQEESRNLVADIKIFRKTTENGNTILIDIQPSKKMTASFRLKLGSPGRSNIRIPGTNKYIVLESI
ncbi:MAG: hypothetical protein ACM3PZ_00375 [Bacillota bacterium]